MVGANAPISSLSPGSWYLYPSFSCPTTLYCLAKTIKGQNKKYRNVGHWAQNIIRKCLLESKAIQMGFTPIKGVSDSTGDYRSIRNFTSHTVAGAGDTSCTTNWFPSSWCEVSLNIMGQFNKNRTFGLREKWNRLRNMLTSLAYDEREHGSWLASKENLFLERAKCSSDAGPCWSSNDEGWWWFCKLFPPQKTWSCCV